MRLTLVIYVLLIMNVCSRIVQHKLLNQLIENIQYVNYRNYRDSIAMVESTIDSLS